MKQEQKTRRKEMKQEQNYLWVGTVSKIVTYGIITLILFFGTFYTISSTERGVLTTFGKVSENVIQPGLHFKLPLMQGITVYDTTTQKYGADATGNTLESASSADLQIIKERVVVNYRIDSLKVVQIYSTIGSSSDIENKIMQPVVHESIKAVTAQFTASDLITQREKVRNSMESLIKSNLNGRGIIVEGVSITEFDFSDEFNKAIEAKVTAVQNAEAAKNKLEQTKYEADQRIAQAKGEAEAISIQASAIQSQGGADYVKLQAIAKWNGQLPVNFYGANGALPFVDVSGMNK